ncbi:MULTISPECIES: LexA family protein [Proteus]|nr:MULTISPECIES: LexA family transcriptional regulator [Proteus]AWF40074.1 helix-turn-helix domain protein [Proteus mirabilis]MDL2105241.1 LexA family transcriptional regulator [Proteus mirabilis]BDR98490.1 repressor [Proteus mirabilis]
MTKQTMSDRINLRMRELKLKSKHIMDATGASKGTVSQWVNGGSEPSAKFLSSLATVLGVSEKWLIDGGLIEETKGNATLGPDITRRVPLVSYVQAGLWKDMLEQQVDEFTEWVETTAKVSNKSFSLRVIGNSMVDTTGRSRISIPEGAIVIVDPEKDIYNGRIVVARLKSSNETTIKQYITDGPNHYLMPINPNYKPIPFDDSCEIIGVCVRIEQDLI